MIDLPPAERTSALSPPVIIAPGPRQASFGDVVVQVDPRSLAVSVTADGRVVARANVTRPRLRLRVPLPPHDVTVRIIARDGTGRRAITSIGPVFGLPRAAWPRAFKSREDRVLAREVRALVDSFPGTAAVFVQDLSTGRGAAWNARARFPAASTLKVPIAIEVLRVLRAVPRPTALTARRLRSMIVSSDNAASNMLLTWLGGSTSDGAARVNTTMRALSLGDSHMYGGYVVGAASTRAIPLRIDRQPAFGISKYTTAWDLAQLHRHLNLAAAGKGPLLRLAGSFTAADARHLLYLLAHVRDPGKLDRFVADGGAAVPHKAGWITTARHDSGLVYWWGGSFVAAVMTWSAAGVGPSADVLAGRVAEAALQRFKALTGAGAEAFAHRAARTPA